MTSQSERVARVQRGSRRQRDLNAATPTFSGIDWAREHLPDENLGFASTAADLEFMRRPPRERRMPTRDEVLDRLRRTGRSREQLEREA